MNETESAKWTCADLPSGWIRSAEPLGSRDAIISGIIEAIIKEYSSNNPDVASHSVMASWITDRIDQYNLSTLDQDVRSRIKAVLAQEGVKVVEK